jgi:hypothetical protein
MKSGGQQERCVIALIKMIPEGMQLRSLAVTFFRYVEKMWQFKFMKSEFKLECIKGNFCEGRTFIVCLVW